MRKWINKHPYWVAFFLVCAVLGMVAARPRGVSRTNSLWVAADTDTPTTTIDSYNGTHNAYISGSLEIDGLAYLDGGVSGTGVISATNITDITRYETIPLTALFINGVGPMGNDGTTAPGMATTDGIPKVIYASSSENASIGYSFVVPTDYVSGLSFRMMISSDTSVSPEHLKIPCSVWVNKDDTDFDAAAVVQTTAVGSVATLAASNEFLVFNLQAATLADLSSGDTVTVWFGNGDTRTDMGATTEIGAIQYRYTATQ